MADSLDSTEAKIVAILHDVIEDTPLTLNDLREAGYPEAIVVALDGLTRREDETYEESIERAATNPLARQVKIADLRDNMDLTRIAHPTETDHARIERYRRALQALSANS